MAARLNSEVSPWCGPIGRDVKRCTDPRPGICILDVQHSGGPGPGVKQFFNPRIQLDLPLGIASKCVARIGIRQVKKTPSERASIVTPNSPYSTSRNAASASDRTREIVDIDNETPPHQGASAAPFSEASEPTFALIGEVLHITGETNEITHHLLVGQGFMLPVEEDFLPVFEFFNTPRTERQAEEWLEWAGAPSGFFEGSRKTWTSGACRHTRLDDCCQVLAGSSADRPVNPGGEAPKRVDWTDDPGICERWLLSHVRHHGAGCSALGQRGEPRYSNRHQKARQGDGWGQGNCSPQGPRAPTYASRAWAR